MTHNLYKKINLSLPAADRFTKLAEYLFFQCHLQVKGRKFYFTELEFYVEYSQHSDKFRHNANEQLQDGAFYFHPSGMDITCGNGKDVYGGVLIRGIKDEQDNWYNKPVCLLNDAILPILLPVPEEYSVKKHSQLLQQFVELKNNEIRKVKMYQGPRHNLVKGRFPASEEDLRQEFKWAPYRYIIDVNVKEHTYASKEKFDFASAMLNPNDTEEFQKCIQKAREWVDLYAYYEKLQEKA